MASSLQYLNFICTDTGKFFAFKDRTKPFHLVAGTKEGDMVKLTNHIKRVGTSQKMLINSVKSAERNECGLYTIAIGPDDIPECKFDLEDNIEVHTISLQDMHTNNFLMDTLMYSGLLVFIVQDVELSDNRSDVKMKGVVLSGQSLEDFISTSEMCTQSLHEYLNNIYNST
jgi:hypothetical protein